jgi:hypothetical protein
MTPSSFADSQLGEVLDLPTFSNSGQPHDAPRAHAAEEIKRLRRCIGALVSVLALPAMWTGAEPVEVAETLLSALLGLLLLDFAYLRLKDAAGATMVSMLRTAASGGSTTPREIGGMLDRHVRDEPESWPTRMRGKAKEEVWALVALPLGLQGERGILVAGSQRAGFPLDTESLVLSVAADQASIGLHEARLALERSRAALERESSLRDLRACYASLSRREREVMARVVAGRLNKQVGSELGISEVTVKAHAAGSGLRR